MGSEQGRRCIAFGVVLMLASIASIGHAEPSAADRETARGLMDQGKARAAEKDLPGALRAFAGAHAIMNVPTTGMALGRAQLAMGQMIEARSTFLAITSLAPVANEPAVFAAARAEAEGLAADLAARIPSIVIVLRGDPKSPTVTVDGAAVPAAALGLPRKVNPGKHSVKASAPGYAEATREVEIAERETKEVAVELQRSTDAEPVVPPVPVASPAKPGRPAARSPEPEPEPEPRGDKRDEYGPGSRSPWTYRGLVLAASGALVGSITGGLSMSKTSAAKQSCQGNVCPASTQGDVDTARTLATVSNVAFALAGVGVVVTVIGVATTPSKKDTSVYVGPLSAGVRGSF